jgi:hypothetical protein
MNTPEIPTSWESLASEPLDAHDGALMQRIAELYDAIDPVPDDLIDRLQFGITLDALNAELAELQLTPAGALASRAAAEASEVKTLTFTSDSLTTMITISVAGPDRVRIDGWCAPGANVSVELRQGSHSLHTEADADGRFVFEDVAHAMTRFVVRPPEPAAHPPVVTPAIEI